MDQKSIHDRARNSIKIDTKNEKVLDQKIFSDQPLKEKLLKSNYALHTGGYFGIFGKIVMFIGACCMVLFFVTGILMYMKRK